MIEHAADNSTVPGIVQPTSKVRRPAILPVIVAIVAITLIVGIGLGLAESTIQSPDTGAAPNFSVTTFDGQPFQLNAQKGKVVLVNFWASWCDTCPAEVTQLNALYDTYKARGLQVIGITHQNISSDAQAFIQKYAIRYPTAPDDGNHAGDQYHIRQVPETYLIAPDGTIALAIHNAIDPTNVGQLRAKLDQLLAAPATKAVTSP